MYLKDVQISAQQKCMLAHFGLHSNCLHHSAPRCVSMSLTYTPAQALHYLPDTAHSSSKPLWEQIWFPLSGGSLIQLLHITRLLGRDWRAAVREVNVRLWQENQWNVRICFDARCRANIQWGIAQLLCSLIVKAADKLIGKWDKAGSVIAPSWHTMPTKGTFEQKQKAYCTNSKNSLLGHKYKEVYCMSKTQGCFVSWRYGGTRTWDYFTDQRKCHIYGYH